MENILAKADLQIISKGNRGTGVYQYTQNDNYSKYTDNGLLWIRKANIVGHGWNSNYHTTFGGFRIITDSFIDKLKTGNTYVLMIDVKGQLDHNLDYFRFSYEMGWEGDNEGLLARPQVIYSKCPVKGFNNMTAIYAFKITDDVYKTCKTKFSDYIVGNKYNSYKQFCMGFGYADDTTIGTELYIKNLRMYDITKYDKIVSFLKTGVIKSNTLTTLINNNSSFCLNKFGTVSVNNFYEN